MKARWVVATIGLLLATLIVGSASASATSRDLDPTFGGGRGWVHSGFMCCDPPRPASDIAEALVVQADGRIVTMGRSWQGTRFLLGLFRYLPDGSPDPSFGSTGTGGVLTRFGKSVLPAGMALQADGKIVVVAEKPRYDSIVLARYNPDGSLDASFGDAGRVLSAPGFRKRASVSSIIIQASGRIIVGGTSSRPSDFALVGYRPDGSLDEAFGTDGAVSIDFADSVDKLADLAIDHEGRILAAGTAIRTRRPIPPSLDPRLDPSMAVARISADGALDPSFGVDARSLVSFTRGFVDDGAVGRAVAVQGDGKVLLAGARRDGPALARLESNGGIDRSFGDRGRLTADRIPLVRGVPMERSLDVVADSDDRIYALTQLDLGHQRPLRAAILGLLPDGSLDSAFSGNGVATARVRHGYDISTIALQPGRILGAGSIENTEKWGRDFAVFAFRP
jgi:uncharacterized delta-60 repeat protein